MLSGILKLLAADFFNAEQSSSSDLISAICSVPMTTLASQLGGLHSGVRTGVYCASFAVEKKLNSLPMENKLPLGLKYLNEIGWGSTLCVSARGQ
jgi:hypothetical protein